MPNALSHMFVGALTGLLISSLFNIPWEFRFLSGFIALIFSLLPDLDHPRGTARKWYRSIGKLLVASLIVPVIYSIGFGLLESFLIALMIAILFVYTSELIIPRHRGVMHSFTFSILLFLMIYLILLFYDVKYALFLALSAFFGYASHLILDRIY